MQDLSKMSDVELAAYRSSLWAQHEEVRAEAVAAGKEVEARRNDPARRLEKKIAEAQAELDTIKPPAPTAVPPTLIVRLKTLLAEVIHGRG
jgi:hypothetical protein